MSFTIDLNTVLMAFIASLIGIIAWVSKGWLEGLRLELTSIHADMKEHNLRSDNTHMRIFKAIAIDEQRLSKLEGWKESKED